MANELSILAVGTEPARQDTGLGDLHGLHRSIAVWYETCEGYLYVYYILLLYYMNYVYIYIYICVYIYIQT